MRAETLEAKLSLLLKEKPTDHGTHSALDKPCTNDIQVNCYRHGGRKLCCIAGCGNGAGLHSLTHLHGVYEIKPEVENESCCLYVCYSHFQSDNLVHSLQTTELPESQLLFKQLTRLSCSLCHQGKHLYFQNPCPQHMLPFLTKTFRFHVTLHISLTKIQVQWKHQSLVILSLSIKCKQKGYEAVRRFRRFYSTIRTG